MAYGSGSRKPAGAKAKAGPKGGAPASNPGPKKTSQLGYGSIKPGEGSMKKHPANRKAGK